MFKTVTQTWNPQTGCLWGCSYCWAKPLSVKFKWPDFFPTFHPKRLNRIFKPDDFVFVTSMGDICFSNGEDRKAINDTIRENAPAKFLIQTKDPSIFTTWPYWAENTYHGVTIETNRPVPMSKAPLPMNRYLWLKKDTHLHKFLSIEPVMDFDLDEFLAWIIDIHPEIIEIGGDNYHNNLPEPSPEKLGKFLNKLEAAGVNVKRKDGLSRLLEDK